MMSNGGWGWWGPGLIFMIFCMVMMVWMMSHHGSHNSHRDQSQRHTPDQADRILAERLARGEIDTDEYERRQAALHQTGERDRT